MNIHFVNIEWFSKERLLMTVYMDEKSRLISIWIARYADMYQRDQRYQSMVAEARANGNNDLTIEELRKEPSEEEVKNNPDKYMILGDAPPKPQEILDWEEENKEELALMRNSEVVAEP